MPTPCRLVIVLLLAASAGRGAWAEPVNLLSLGAGALPVVEPPTYGSWPVISLLDDSPQSGWAGDEGKVTQLVFVFELPQAAKLTAFEFDAASIDGPGRAAKDVLVEVSPTGKESGFQPVLRASLKEGVDNQRFHAAPAVAGQWVRLTIANNHGDAAWNELMGFRGLGEPPVTKPIADVSGTFESDYGDFHVRQTGTALIGCYEHDEGLLSGTVEGHVMKLTWQEAGGPDDRGPAVMVFAGDGQGFRGHWWYQNGAAGTAAGVWNGRKKSNEVGTCPHWSGSVRGELARELAGGTKRARLYGVLFDPDSATIRPESFPTLDQVIDLLRSEPEWKMTIEGHTDSTNTDEHNRTLSEARAKAVKDYLVSKGIDTARLAAVGLGESRPVAGNDTDLGRAQNRRVELVRQ